MGEKKAKGRKRHIVTDTLGHMLHVQVHAANTHDTVGGCPVVEKTLEKYPTLDHKIMNTGSNIYSKSLWWISFLFLSALVFSTSAFFRLAVL